MTKQRRVPAPLEGDSPASERMRAQRVRDTDPEINLRSELHRLGLRFRLHRKVPGLPRRKIDIAFVAPKVAVFVDGCFWHGCPDHFAHPKTNAAFWSKKISGNRARDIDTSSELESLGWKVIRVWEHQDMRRAARYISATVRKRQERSRKE